MWIELWQAAQQVGEQAITTAKEHGDIGEKTVSQLPIAYGIVKAIEFAKNTNIWGLRWISQKSSPALLMTVNGITAFLVAAGVSGTFQYADTGTLTVVVTGLSDMGSKLFSFGSQWAFQQFFYENTQSRKVAITTHNVIMGTGPGDVSAESANPTGKTPGTGDGKAA